MKIVLADTPIESYIVTLEDKETSDDFLFEVMPNLALSDEDASLMAVATRGVILASNGLAIFVKGEFFSFVRTVEPYPGMKHVFPMYGGSVSDSGYDSYPKIPNDVFRKVVGFFYDVYKAYKSEAYVSLWYDKDSDEWQIVVPDQKVSAGSAEYDECVPPGKNFVCVGDIHSHGSMRASHSGTDDNDEIGKRDGIHITLGDFDTARWTYSGRIVIGEFVRKVELDEVVDGYEMTYPKEWMDAVEPKHSTIVMGGGSKKWLGHERDGAYNPYGWGVDS